MIWRFRQVTITQDQSLITTAVIMTIKNLILDRGLHLSLFHGSIQLHWMRKLRVNSINNSLYKKFSIATIQRLQYLSWDFKILTREEKNLDKALQEIIGNSGLISTTQFCKMHQDEMEIHHHRYLLKEI